MLAVSMRPVRTEVHEMVGQAEAFDERARISDEDAFLPGVQSNLHVEELLQSPLCDYARWRKLRLLLVWEEVQHQKTPRTAYGRSHRDKTLRLQRLLQVLSEEGQSSPAHVDPQ